MQVVSSILGLSAILLFLIFFSVFAVLTEAFDPLNDVVSKLGATGQPFGFWWNTLGFGLVGLLMSSFGYTFGKSIHDRLTGTLLALYGLAFAAISIPTVIGQSEDAQSRVHFAVVCLCMAFWFGAIARLSAISKFSGRLQFYSYGSVIVTIVAILGVGAELLSTAVFQRLFFGAMFCWIAAISIENLIGKKD